MPTTGQKNPAAGIYECRRCRKKKTVPKGHKLPPCKCGGTDWVPVTTTTRGKKKGFFESLFS